MSLKFAAQKYLWKFRYRRARTSGRASWGCPDVMRLWKLVGATTTTDMCKQGMLAKDSQSRAGPAKQPAPMMGNATALFRELNMKCA